MNAFAIQWEGARKEYADGVVALDSLTLGARTGEILAIVGRSGSGKTTALRLIRETNANRLELESPRPPCQPSSARSRRRLSGSPGT